MITVNTAVESVFVIGGSSLYADAVAKPQLCERVYLTSVERVKDATVGEQDAAKENPKNVGDAPAGFECDAFFPELQEANYRLVRTSAPQREKGIEYTFCEYTAHAGATSVPSSLGRAAPAVQSPRRGATRCAATPISSRRSRTRLRRGCLARPRRSA